MRVAVTGGAGFIGRHLVEALALAGHSVVVLDNLRRGRLDPASGAAARFACGDVRELADCMRAFEGCEAVIHLAAQANVMGTESDPDYAFETNVAGTWNVARASMLCGVRHLVFASSREVYGNALGLPVRECDPLRPHNLYGATKASGEAILSALRTPAFGVSILRLTNVIGAGDRDRVVPNWLRAARAGEPLVMFGGTQELDLVPVDFVVEVVMRVTTGQALAGPVNVGTGTGTRLPDLADHILRATGSSSTIEIRPPRGAEVVRFRADVSRLVETLELTPPADPLAAIRPDW